MKSLPLYRLLIGVALSGAIASCNGPQQSEATDKPSAAYSGITTVRHNFALRSGSLQLYVDFPSVHLAARNVSVWLPDGYSPDKEYATLYMHDGQMLFDASATWNRQEWGVDEIAQSLIDSGKVRPFIVVGIWSRPEARYEEYFPQKPFESLPEAFVDSLSDLALRQGRFLQPFRADRYLKFIVEELRPFIQHSYPVGEGPEHTFIAGSSMGGLISMYAQAEYPEVFGGAACISTHWPGLFQNEGNPVPDAFIAYLDQHLPSADSPNRWYFDYGDKTLDSLYPPHQERVDSLMVAKGFGSERWVTEFYPGADHSEDSWRARLHRPLEFLLSQ